MKKRIYVIITTFLLLIAGCSKPTSTALTNQNNPVTIAVIDTGFSSVAIPNQYILEGKNYIDESLDTEDTYGHGTAVASIILKNCSNVLLVPLVSNAYDNGKMIQVENDVFAKMIIDAVDVYDCDIINISAGLILDKDSIYQAIQYAEENNVLVVASVGNDYIETGSFRYFPAAYDTVLAVGSVDKNGKQISDFSQRGEWVDIYTCGEDVTITTLSGNARTSNGTSYSAARISAYAANLLSQSTENLSSADLRNMIIDDAQTLTDGTKYLP